MKRVAILLALAGCDRLFALEPVPNPVADAPPGVCAHGFVAHVDYPAGTSPSAIAIGRIDADDSLDIVVGHESGALYVYLNTGTGQFGPPIVTTLDGGIAAVATGRLGTDMNADVVATTPSTGGIHVLSGVGDGTFVDAPQPIGGAAFGVAIARLLNTDALMDVAITLSDANSVWFGLGDKDGAITFDSAQPTGVGPLSILVGDLDRDSILDVATVNVGDNTITAMFGGDTVPAVDVRNYDVGFSPHGIAAGQLIGDANIDLVTAVTGNTLYVLRGGEIPRTFIGEVGPQISGTALSQLASAELTGEPGVDLAVANQAASTVTVMASPLGGARDDLAVGRDPIAIAVGDLDGDARNDVVTANRGDNTVSVLLSCTP